MALVSLPPGSKDIERVASATPVTLNRCANVIEGNAKMVDQTKNDLDPVLATMHEPTESDLLFKSADEITSRRTSTSGRVLIAASAASLTSSIFGWKLSAFFGVQSETKIEPYQVAIFSFVIIAMLMFQHWVNWNPDRKKIEKLWSKKHQEAKRKGWQKARKELSDRLNELISQVKKAAPHMLKPIVDKHDIRKSNDNVGPRLEELADLKDRLERIDKADALQIPRLRSLRFQIDGLHLGLPMGLGLSAIIWLAIVWLPGVGPALKKMAACFC